MSKRPVFLGISLLLLLFLETLPAFATEVFQGKITSVGKDMLSMEAPAGKKMTFFVAKEATILRDGKPAKLQELKADELATVTTDNKGVAVIVAVRSVKPNVPVSAP